MRLGWLVLRSTIATCALVTLTALTASAAKRGDVLPLFSAPDLEGRPVNVAEIVGRRRVALLFWDWRRATSIRALQTLDRLAETYADEGLTVIALEGEGASAEQVLERVEKLRAIGVRQGYTIVPDPGGRIALQLGLVGTPQLILVDRAGRVFEHFEKLLAEDEPTMEQRVRELLRLDAPAARPEQAQPRPAGTPASPPALPGAPAAPVDPSQALLEKWRYFGGYHLNRGEPEKAEEYFRKYVELAPQDVSGWLRLGEACARQGRRDAAREAWERVLRLAPGNAEADANIRRLIRGE